MLFDTYKMSSGGFRHLQLTTPLPHLTVEEVPAYHELVIFLGNQASKLVKFKNTGHPSR
jgi:hypothetical protein